MLIYWKGGIVPEAEATVPANDHGFLYGVGLFETFRTYGGRPFLLEEHMSRLKAGCRLLRILPGEDHLAGAEPPFSALRETVQRLLSANDLTDAIFRYTLSAGEAAGGLPREAYTRPGEMIHVRPLHPPLPQIGHRIHILHTHRTEPEAWPRPKSLHYANSLAGHWELLDRAHLPGDEGLMLTADRRLAEGVVSNIFLVTEGSLRTPALSAGILGGVTRRAVLDLAPAAGLKAREEDLRLPDLTGSDAIFTTNSTRGISPVHEVLDERGGTLWQKRSHQHEAVLRLDGAYRRLWSE